MLWVLASVSGTMAQQSSVTPLPSATTLLSASSPVSPTPTSANPTSSSAATSIPTFSGDHDRSSLPSFNPHRPVPSPPSGDTLIGLNASADADVIGTRLLILLCVLAFGLILSALSMSFHLRRRRKRLMRRQQRRGMLGGEESMLEEGEDWPPSPMVEEATIMIMDATGRAVPIRILRAGSEGWWIPDSECNNEILEKFLEPLPVYRPPTPGTPSPALQAALQAAAAAPPPVPTSPPLPPTSAPLTISTSTRPRPTSSFGSAPHPSSPIASAAAESSPFEDVILQQPRRASVPHHGSLRRMSSAGTMSLIDISDVGEQSLPARRVVSPPPGYNVSERS
ncbi:hypothetical protein HK102_010703 [Quaeritorhiza haematococci]|nr:hypothetical protein HK102_010703 [Quaeritorhiza haematococci]